MMFSRSRQGNALARFEAYKLRNRLDTKTAHEALRYCFRFIKKGQSCALIVADMQSVRIVMEILQGDQYYRDLAVFKRKEDGIIFEDEVEFRVLPKNNEPLAPIMIGKNVKIIQAREGDPKMKKFKEIMGLS